MFDRAKFAAALLLVSAIVLTGCSAGDPGNPATGDAPGVPVVGGDTPEVPVRRSRPEVPVPEVPVPEVPVPEVPVVTSPEVRVIQHPGVGLSLSDLQTLKANVDQGKEPWKSGFDQLANSPTSRLSYAGRGGPFATVSRAPHVNLKPGAAT